jgi:hypothetical protein
LLVVASCSFTRPVQPGEGSTSQAAHQRLGEEARQAELDAVTRACRVAAVRTEDVRMQRKCLVLAGEHHQVVAARRDGTKVDVRQLAGAARDQAAASCGARVEAARFDAVLGDDASAAKLYITAVRECSQPEAAIDAAFHLKKLKRCPDAIALVGEAWRTLPKASWIDAMDAVATCSDAVTLRSNLSFVPADVRKDYFALLDRRGAEQQRREREYRERREREAAVSSCRSSCSSAESSCSGSCFGRGDACYSRCRSLADLCASGCY